MRRTVLLVEDNPFTRKMVNFALSDAEIDVLEAPDGASALALLEQRHVDLVLQDLVLPDLDGFKLLERIRRLPAGASIPVLAVSGMVSRSDESRMSAVGFDDVITKPVEPAQLVRIVQAHLPMVPPTQTFGEKRRVLVVDDDAVQRKLTCFVLERVGFEVEGAADGLEALKRLRERAPEALVSDVLMPRLDGFGLCARVREDPALAHIPVILATNSYVEPQDEQLAKQAGADAFVIRTPDLHNVLGALQQALERDRSERSLPTGGAGLASGPQQLDRLVRQLDRQVDLTAGVVQRCALLSAELAVLGGISEALATQRSTDDALQHALAACLDAGGISRGALLVTQPGSERILTFGSANGWSAESVRGYLTQLDLFGDEDDLPPPVRVPDDVPPSTARELLEACQSEAALLLPLVYRGTHLGVLLLASGSRLLFEDDRRQFAQTVAAQICQAIAITRTFEAQERSQRLARERTEVLETILASIGDGVVVAAADGRLTHFNPAAEKILHAGRVDQDAEHWSQTYGLFQPDRVTRLGTDELPLIRASRGETVDDVEIYVRPADGSEPLWISVNARPLGTAAEGERVGAVAAFSDITARKQTQARELASDRLATMGMLAAGIAHEINTPLAALVANLDLAVGELEVIDCPEELTEMLHEAREGATRVRQIAKDLRLFARSEEPAERQPVANVQEVMESSIRMAINEVRHRAMLQREYHDVPPVRGAAAKLGQVFLNLLVNAAQAIDAGSASENIIRVVTERVANDLVRVTVSDTGSGMDDNAKARLFTPFFTTKPRGTGTGLGLSICQRIITDIGGRIEVESAPGEGSAFHVLLPVASGLPAEPPRQQGRPIPAQPASARRGRVLIVDDEPIITRTLRRVLGRFHDVTSCHNGREALERIRAGETFDAILCDLMMPEVTGVQVHQALQREAPELARRMVVISGGAFGDEGEYLETHRIPQIAKPFDLEQILQSVGRLVEEASGTER